MFIELVDSLRCLEAHDETWLVAAVTRMDGRHVAEGVLGCPICRREYPIRDGIAWFTATAPDAEHLTRVGQTADSDRIMRAGALLGLTDVGGIVCVDAAWSDCADALAELGPAHVVVLNATVDSAADRVSVLAVDDRLPLARGSVRAAAVGDASSGLVAPAVESLRAGARLVGPANAPVPDGVTELVRDDHVWVGERGAVASAPISLRSARR